MIHWIAVLMLLWGVPVEARVFTETTIVCNGDLRAELDTQGNPHLYAQCATYDSTNTIVRAPREYDVINQLTTQQKNGLITILQNLAAYAAQNQSVPTPTPTSTP